MRLIEKKIRDRINGYKKPYKENIYYKRKIRIEELEWVLQELQKESDFLQGVLCALETIRNITNKGDCNTRPLLLPIKDLAEMAIQKVKQEMDDE